MSIGVKAARVGVSGRCEQPLAAEAIVRNRLQDIGLIQVVRKIRRRTAREKDGRERTLLHCTAQLHTAHHCNCQEADESRELQPKR